MLTDRDRLFAVAALRKGVLSEEQLAEVCERVASDDDQSLISGLASQGAVSLADLQAFDARLDTLLNRLTGDRHKNLRSRANQRVREALGEIKNERLRQLLHSNGAALEVLPSRIACASVSYRLLGVRGEGGLGRVWIARDEALHRDVAIKEVRPDKSADHAHYRRFLREALLTGRLQHPNIVPVYHQGAGADGERPFFVMRLLGGRTLQETIAEYHQLATEGLSGRLFSLIATLIRVCDAIAYAHSQGIIHRDLKPENIMDAEFGEVLVLDWGLAKQVGEPDDPSLDVQLPESASYDLCSDLTRIGAVMGSPGYMAPEQAAGAVGQLDFRTDVYGLGAILFAILAGRPPHPQPKGGSVNNVLMRIISEPSPRVLAVAPNAPRALDAICARAMAHAREDRYPSVQEFANDLKRWSTRQPVSAYRERWPRRMARWASNHQFFVQSAMLVLIAITIIATGVCIHTWKEQRALKQLAFDSFYHDTVAFEVGLTTRVDQFRLNVQFVSALPTLREYIETSETAARSISLERIKQVFLGFTQSHDNYFELALIGLGANAPRSVGFHKELGFPQPLGAHESQRVQKIVHWAFPVGVERWKPNDVHLSDVREQESRDGQIVFSPHIWAATAVMNSKTSKLFGIVAARLELAPLFDMLRNTYAPQDTIFVTAASGEILYQSDRFDSNRPWSIESQRIQQLFSQLEPFFASQSAQHRLTLQEPSSHLYIGQVAFDPGAPDRHVCVVIKRSLDGTDTDSDQGSTLIIGMSAALVVTAVAAMFAFSRVTSASQ